MSKTFYIVTVSLILLILSCSNPQPEAPELLRQAEQLAESNPDSAMLLIDSIHYPEKRLKHGLYVHFGIAKTQLTYSVCNAINEAARNGGVKVVQAS